MQSKKFGSSRSRSDVHVAIECKYCGSIIPGASYQKHVIICKEGGSRGSRIHVYDVRGDYLVPLESYTLRTRKHNKIYQDYAYEKECLYSFTLRLASIAVREGVIPREQIENYMESEKKRYVSEMRK